MLNRVGRQVLSILLMKIKLVLPVRRGIFDHFLLFKNFFLASAIGSSLHFPSAFLLPLLIFNCSWASSSSKLLSLDELYFLPRSSTLWPGFSSITDNFKAKIILQFLSWAFLFKQLWTHVLQPQKESLKLTSNSPSLLHNSPTSWNKDSISSLEILLKPRISFLTFCSLSTENTLYFKRLHKPQKIYIIINTNCWSLCGSIASFPPPEDDPLLPCSLDHESILPSQWSYAVISLSHPYFFSL